MGIYVGIIVLVLLLGLFLKPNSVEKNKKKYFIIVFIILSAVSCFRSSSVGADTGMYIEVFSKMPNYNLLYLLREVRFEDGFVIFCKLLSIINKSPQFLLIVSSLIINYFVLRFIYKNSNNCILSILIFIFLNYYFMYLTAMRQALAICILLFGYDNYYKDKKKFRFLLTIIVASLFHNSALVSILLLFIPEKKYSNTMFYFVFASSIGAYFFADKIFTIFTFANKYSFYLTSQYYKGSDIAGIMNYLVCLIFLFFSFKYGKKINNKKFNNYLYILSINLMFYALAARISIFTRITTYFNIFNIVFLPLVIAEIEKFQNKKILKILFYIMIISYWLIISIFRPEWYGVIPYSSVFFGG